MCCATTRPTCPTSASRKDFRGCTIAPVIPRSQRRRPEWPRLRPGSGAALLRGLLPFHRSAETERMTRIESNRCSWSGGRDASEWPGNDVVTSIDRNVRISFKIRCKELWRVKKLFLQHLSSLGFWLLLACYNTISKIIQIHANVQRLKRTLKL